MEKNLIQNTLNVYKSFVRSAYYRYKDEPNFDIDKYKAAAFDNLVSVLEYQISDDNKEDNSNN